MPKAKLVVYVKLGVFTIGAVSMIAWCVTLAGGIGNVLRQSGTAKGSTRQWLLVKFFFLGMSSAATFTTDAADFQRYTKRPNDVLLGQVAGGPIATLIVRFMGVVVAGSSTLIFDEVVWNPLLILDGILKRNYSSTNRAGCFFISLSFAYSSLVTMVLANILPAANDLSGLIPKYINYKRGAYVAAVLGLAINPWWLLGSASIFVSYMSSFGIFYASVIGVMIMHYYAVTRGVIDIPSLFHDSKTGTYYYWHGVNVRAYVAYFCGIIPTMDGFAGAVGRTIPIPAQHFYFFAFPVGLVVSSSVYLLLCHIWPVPNQVSMRQAGWLEPKDYVAEDDVDDEVGATPVGSVIEGKDVDDRRRPRTETTKEMLNI